MDRELQNPFGEGIVEAELKENFFSIIENCWQGDPGTRTNQPYGYYRRVRLRVWACIKNGPNQLLVGLKLVQLTLANIDNQALGFW